VAAVCRQLGYSKQAYYKSSYHKGVKAIHWAAIREEVLLWRKRMPRLGTRKLYFLLKERFRSMSIGIGRDRLFDFLRSEGLLIKRKKKYAKTTDSRHWLRRYPNQIKGVKLRRPEQIWVADITYIQLRTGPCFLHLITDAYSKRVMGYHVSDTLAASHTLQALNQALKSRCYKEELIHHSDRGLQYCSAGYTKKLKDQRVQISMTESGSPYDNAIAERINGILKSEFALDDTFEAREYVDKQIKQSIDTYNTLRPHDSNHGLTPNQMHQQNVLIPKAWPKKYRRAL